MQGREPLRITPRFPDPPGSACVFLVDGLGCVCLAGSTESSASVVPGIRPRDDLRNRPSLPVIVVALLQGGQRIGSGCLESISVPTIAFGLGFATAVSGRGSAMVLTSSVLLVPPEHYAGHEEQRKQHPKHWPDVHGNVHRSSLTMAGAHEVAWRLGTSPSCLA